MQYCEKCRVSVRGSDEKCPLCQSKLSGTAETAQYPKISTANSKLAFGIRIAALATVLLCIAAGAVNIIVTPGEHWALIAISAALCLWICFLYAVKKRKKLSRNIIVQVILVCLLSVVWDIATGYKAWSVNFVVPCACSSAAIALEILALVLKMPASDYMFCLLWDSIFGLVPLILIMTGNVSVMLPSVVCIAISVAVVFFTAIFYGKEIVLEIQKRFHM